MAEPIRTFVVYSREDKQHIDSMRKFLKPSTNKGDIEVWFDGELIPGEHWEPKIKRRLYNADLVLLLVSADYFDSNYIQGTELKIVQERFAKKRCKVVPILVRDCDWSEDDFVNKLQVIPSEGKAVASRHFHNEDEAWAEVVRGLKKAFDETRSLRQRSIDNNHADWLKLEQKDDLGRIDAFLADWHEDNYDDEALHLGKALEKKERLIAEAAEKKRLADEAAAAAALENRLLVENTQLKAENAAATTLIVRLEAALSIEKAAHEKIIADMQALQVKMATEKAAHEKALADKRDLQATLKADNASLLTRAQTAEAQAKNLAESIARLETALVSEKAAHEKALADKRDLQAKMLQLENANNEASAWDLAQKINTREAYQIFLELYPDGDYAKAARAALPVKHETYQETINGVAFTMIAIPGGTFTMGATPEQLDAEDREKPPHKVTLSAYFLAETLVTQALWEAVMGNNPSKFKGASDLPVESVSWEDAQLFIQKLNALKNPSGPIYRLPTEAEWEYAAREGGRAVLFGNGKMVADPLEMNFNASVEHKMQYSKLGPYRGKTTAVKAFAPNVLGLYDMSGNVREWCQDWYGNYPNSPLENPPGPKTGSSRVIRGGSWDGGPQGCRVAHRGYGTPVHRNILVGFRLASQ